MNRSIDSRIAAVTAGLGLLLTGCQRDRTSELIAQLEDPAAEVRRSAARSLGEHPPSGRQVAAALAEAATDEDADVRRLSVHALGRMQPAGSEIISALETALADRETPVRIAAALALERADPQNRSYTPVLVAALRTGDGRVMREVGAMGGRAGWAVPPLTELLATGEPQVRALAAQTLGRLGPAAIGARPALQRAIRDANAAVQDSARHALELIPEKRP